MIQTKPTQPFLRKGHPLNDGLVAAWLFSEGGGDTTRDLSGRSLHGTLINGPRWVATPYGWGLEFTSANSQYIRTNPKVRQTEPLSVIAWATYGGVGTIAGQRGNPSSNVGWTFSFQDPPRLKFTIFGAVDQFSAATTFNLGEWYQVGVTYDRRYIRFYVNGCLLSEHVETRPITASTQDLLLFASNNYGSPAGYYDGLAAMQLIYSRALTPAEIRTLAGLDGDPWEQWRPYSALDYDVPLIVPKSYPKSHRLRESTGMNRIQKDITFSGDSGAIPLFTITGDVIVRIIPVIIDDLGSTEGAKIRLGTTTSTNAIISDTLATNMVARKIWHDISPNSEAEPESVRPDYIVTDGNIIQLSLDKQVDSGSISFYCYWSPLSANGRVEGA